MNAKNTEMLTNLLPLKATNGMFYFAKDYIRQLKRPHHVFVAQKLSGAQEGWHSSEVELKSAIWLTILKIWFNGFFGKVAIFTPTPHPLPFISRQLVVVHDSFPFKGWKGSIKKWLFKLSLMTSKCKVAYINHSDSKRFVESCLSDKRRHVYLPNHYPGVSSSRVKRQRLDSDYLKVALVGTDSSKKNYGLLFDAIRRLGMRDMVRFFVYGHNTAYFEKVKSEFSDMEIELTMSDAVDLHSFFEKVDCLVSVAKNEGFGRPIAYALSLGIPCFLIEDEVFREFYNGMAVFSSTVEELIGKILEHEQGWSSSISELSQRRDFPPATVLKAIADGKEILEKL